MKSVLGVSMTPEFILKLLALVFAFGVIVQRVDSQAISVKEQMQAEERINYLRFSDIQQRLSRVENKLDKLP